MAYQMGAEQWVPAGQCAFQDLLPSSCCANPPLDLQTTLISTDAGTRYQGHLIQEALE